MTVWEEGAGPPRAAAALAAAPVGVTISDARRPDNPLIYANPAFEAITGYDRTEIQGRNCRFLQGPETDPEPVAALREAIDAEEPVTVELRNYTAEGELFWNRVTVAPIRDGEDGAVTHYVGFQEAVTERVEAQRDLEARTADLEHLVGRIDGVLGDVTETLMHATDRESGQQAVVDRVADADPYVYAWLGEPDRVADAVVPRAWAGEGDPVEGLSIPRESDDPTARAVADRHLQIDDVAGTAAAGAVPGATTVAAIPIAYGETVYGVLSVYASDPDAFGGREPVVLRALGRTVGAAIHAAATERVLTADNLVELELEGTDESLFPVALADELGVGLTFEGSVNRQSGGLAAFFATGTPLGTTDAPDGATDGTGSGSDREGDHESAYVADAADCHPEIVDCTVLSRRGDGDVLEVGLAPDSLLDALAARGARTREITAEPGRVRLTVTLPVEADPGDLVDWLRERSPGTSLVARRERDRPAGTERPRPDPELTDRQRTALHRAHVAGYFEPDRGTTGDELADSMGISRSTFHQHLRAAQRKLVAAHFEGEGPLRL